jgi:hypothetical protein
MRLFRSRRHSEPPSALAPNSREGIEYQTVKAMPAVVLEEATPREMKRSKCRCGDRNIFLFSSESMFSIFSLSPIYKYRITI